MDCLNCDSIMYLAGQDADGQPIWLCPACGFQFTDYYIELDEFSDWDDGDEDDEGGLRVRDGLPF